MHDRDPRATPYDLVFGAAPFEDEIFPGIREEAEARGVATTSPAAFLMLGTVGAVLRDFMPEPEVPEFAAGRVSEPVEASHIVERPGPADARSSAGNEPAVGAARGADAESGAVPTAGELLDEFGRLLYQGYHFWSHGRRVLDLDEAAARRLVDAPLSRQPSELRAPHPAGYLRLPRHLFWVQVMPARPPEPVDGMFWTIFGDEVPDEPPFSRLDVVLVAGMRPDRPGFSTVGVTADLTTASLAHRLTQSARPDGRDFESVLPGGELRRLYSLTTVDEVVKLVALVFSWTAKGETRKARGQG